MGTFNWDTFFNSQWAITVGGGLAVALAGWLAKVIFDRRTKEPAQASLAQTAPPVMTQHVNIYPNAIATPAPKTTFKLRSNATLFRPQKRKSGAYFNWNTLYTISS